MHSKIFPKKQKQEISLGTVTLKNDQNEKKFRFDLPPNIHCNLKISDFLY